MTISFFSGSNGTYLVQAKRILIPEELEKLQWMLDGTVTGTSKVAGPFVGPRREMVTPWSTNATDIARSIGIDCIERIEEFQLVEDRGNKKVDPMLEQVYESLDLTIFEVDREPEPVRAIADLRAYNETAALALSDEELSYLENESKRMGRLLTDAELYGFAQINSEHCRHKIFNGSFEIDGVVQPRSLFQMIKETAAKAPEQLVSAYKDNVAFVKGPEISAFVPESSNPGAAFTIAKRNAVLSLKAETHNFPTTVEPFFGASTGSGGEIRDRMAGGQGSIPLAGVAVYMTSYPRLGAKRASIRESQVPERKWKYQTPSEILVKASLGASDFGNKFGQPLITGSVLTFEAKTTRGTYGFDRTIMLAGGVGYGRLEQAQKREARIGDVILVLGGDNYRIGMAGGSVSSVDTGRYGRQVELSAVQRANPEMQKRVYNVVRALFEAEVNPTLLIHDHGAGGHMNCLAELVEPLGGKISVDALPIGDKTLSVKEILSNESQERMGLIVPESAVELVRSIADRERAPCYVVGKIVGDKKLVFARENGEKPVDLELTSLFGSTPKLVLRDSTISTKESECPHEAYSPSEFREVLFRVLSHESVACKDWLTNKVDRSVTGLVARQQEVGPLHLPLANCGVMALDFTGTVGTATAVGHAPVVGLIDERAGSVLSVTEALTNLVWAPLVEGLKSVVLSANWMWPAKQSGEDVRLYRAVEALSDFCKQLEIAVPTGKDSLSMTMKYEDGTTVRAPGTVVVTAMGCCSDIRRVVTPDMKPELDSKLLWLDLSGQDSMPLGGSVLAQELGALGGEVPTVVSVDVLKGGFELVQFLIREDLLLAGHDISEGGLITAVCEMVMTGDAGCKLTLPKLIRASSELFTQKPGLVLQVRSGDVERIRSRAAGIAPRIIELGVVAGKDVSIQGDGFALTLSRDELLREWFAPSAALDALQTTPFCSAVRTASLEKRRLQYSFPKNFDGLASTIGFDMSLSKGASRKRAAIVREKGTNGDRELAFALFTAGFEVCDITMVDLVSGKAGLADISVAAFPGGFSNSDVFGAGKGWAGAFRFNERARREMDAFFARPDTLSIGVCNGCQLVSNFDVFRGKTEKPLVRLAHNESGRFECGFVLVDTLESPCIWLKPLESTRLGVWIAHGEGRFVFDEERLSDLRIAMKYSVSEYPMTPNGSAHGVAAICSADGRHLAVMPHFERSLFPWNWPYYQRGQELQHEVSPWALAFKAAHRWVEGR